MATTPSPVTPNQLKGAVPDPNSSLCGNFKKALLTFPLFLYQIFNWMLDADGNLTNNFISLMIKPGDLIFSASPSSPGADRLLCNGATVSRATYANLFAVIGTTYGVGDGSTTFTIPDYRDKFPIGAGNTYNLGDTGGTAEETLQLAQTPAHTHAIGHTRATVSGLSADPAGGLLGAGAGSDISYNTNSKGGGDPHNNLPPYVACYVYIKT